MFIPKVCIDVKIEKNFSLTEWEAWDEMSEERRKSVVEEMNSDDAITDLANSLGFSPSAVKSFKYYIKEG